MHTPWRLGGDLLHLFPTAFAVLAATFRNPPVQTSTGISSSAAAPSLAPIITHRAISPDDAIARNAPWPFAQIGVQLNSLHPGRSPPVFRRRGRARQIFPA